MGLLTTGTGLMDYPSRYTKYPRSYTEDAGRALREGISTWAQMYPSYRREQQDYALQQQALEEKQQEKQRFSQILGKLRQQPLPGMNPAMIDQISMLDPKRGLDTLYNMYSGVKPVQEFKTLSSQEEIEHFGSDLPGNFQIGYDKKITQIAGSKPLEVKAPSPVKMDRNWAYSILNQVLLAKQKNQPMPPQNHIDTAAAILEAGTLDPKTGFFVKSPIPQALTQSRSGKVPAATTTFSGQGLIRPKKGQGISHVLTSAGLEYNQENVKQFLEDNGTTFNPNGSVKTYGSKFEPPQGKMKFPDNMPGLRIDIPYSVGALDQTMVEQINRVDATTDAQEQVQIPQNLTSDEIAKKRLELLQAEEHRRKSRLTTKIKGKAVDMVATNQALLKTLYQMARITYGKSYADRLIQRPNAKGEMEKLVDDQFVKTAENGLLEVGITPSDEGIGFELYGETAGVLSMLHKDLFNQIRAAYEFGAPQQAEFEFFDKMIKDPSAVTAYFNPVARSQFRGQLLMMFNQANSRLKIWDALSIGSGLDPGLIRELRGLQVLGKKNEDGSDLWDAFTDISPTKNRDTYRNDNQLD